VADDFVMAQLALESDLAAEAALRQQRRDLETALSDAREAEQAADEAARAVVPELMRTQDTWYALAALLERLGSTLSIARERVRNAESVGDDGRRGRDPEAIEAEAAEVRTQEEALSAEVSALGKDSSATTTGLRSSTRPRCARSPTAARGWRA